MPIYEFRCQGCGRHVEVWLRTSGDAAICPQCGASLHEKLFSTPFVMSGDNQRPAGSTCCGREERCDTPGCSTNGACARG
jgi:putative FmdB family regulatory protein